MYKPKELKLNKFVDVKIPKNSEFFSRMHGNFPTIPTSAYSGDEPVPVEGRTTDVLADMDAYDKMMQKREYLDSIKKSE